MPINVSIEPLSRRRGGRRWARRTSLAAGLSLAALAAGAAGASAAPVPLGPPASVPLVGGWHAPRAQVGSAVPVSAKSVLTAARGDRLAYEWSIVSAPHGSRAELTDRSSADPRLRPDLPGRYMLKVVTGEVPIGSAGHSTSLCSSRCLTQEVMVDAAVSGGPVGVPVDTIAWNNGQWGVQVGDQTTAGAQFYAAPDQTDALQLLVLDRSTLAEVDNESFSNDTIGAGNLYTTVANLPSTDLVVITRPDVENNSAANSNEMNASSAWTYVNLALARIGAPSLPMVAATGDAVGVWAGTQSRSCSSFSAVGVRGLPAGQGRESACAVNTSVTGTELTGYFRQDLSPERNYTFVDDARVPFDTGDPNADPAVVTVGSDEAGSIDPKTTYTSQDLNGGAGFYVLVLDSGSLMLRDQETYTDDYNGLQQLSMELGAWTNDPAVTVIIRTIGKVGPPQDGGSAGAIVFDQVAQQLQQIGGSRFYFEALNGSSDSEYAQVGPSGTPGYPNPYTQVASPTNAASGRLTGLLAYNNSNQFYPEESYPTNLQDPNRPLAGTLSGIISLPPSAWPDRNTPGDQNVLACVDHHLPVGPLKLPIESNYTNLNLANEWSGWAAYIGEASYYQTLTGDSNCGPFTQSDFDAVITQLQTEWNDVALVDSLISSLQTPLLDSQGNATQIASITNTVATDVDSGSQETTVDGLGLTSDMLWLASSLPGLDEISGPLNVFAAGLGIADGMTNSSSGANLPSEQVTTTGTGLAATLEQQYTTSIQGLGNIGDILVSDWTKLQDAAQNAADTQNAAADWSWTNQQAIAATDQLLVSARQTAYEKLFPLNYSLYRLAAGTAGQQSATAYTCAQWITGPYTSQLNTWQPFTNAADQGSFTASVIPGQQEQWVFAGEDQSVLTSGGDAQVPGQTVLNGLFGPPQDGDIQTAPLFNPLQFAVEAYQDANTKTVEVTHYHDSAGGPGGGSSDDFCKIVTGG
jgi:hypothetical protein